jgi:hypothetical protein
MSRKAVRPDDKRLNGSLAERFERKYLPEPNSGCWLWTGVVNKKGYGHIAAPKRRQMLSAHRVSYELYVGPIPDGLQIDHLCRVRCCVNPAHLEPVTPQENSRRGIAGKLSGQRKLANTHCPQGHPYSEDNIYDISKYGHRVCKTCARINARKQNAKQKGIRKRSRR